MNYGCNDPFVQNPPNPTIIIQTGLNTFAAGGVERVRLQIAIKSEYF
jgi:hypothetical protein